MRAVRYLWSGWWRHPLGQALVLTFVSALALHLWRPLFHLTDDSLSAWLPIAVEFYEKLWTGRWPFVSDHVFGGNYNWLSDPMVFSLVGPHLLLFSPLVLTRFYFLLPDLVATFILLTTAGAFCGSALYLRKRLDLAISDGWIVFLSFSYTFTVYALLVNASWIMFINVHASYPVVFAALFARSIWRGAVAVAAAVVFSLLGSHPHPFCYLLIFGGLLALGVAWALRSWKPTLVFAAGATIAVIVLLPLIVPVLNGFIASWRGGEMQVGFTRSFNVPAGHLAASWLLGPAALLLHRPMQLHYAEPVFVAGLAWTLINLPLVFVLLHRRRRFSRVETVLVVTAFLCALFVARPVWLAELLAQIPLVRSLRWPFREIAVLNAITHLLAVLCLTPQLQRVFRFGALASAPLGAAFLFFPAPTFNPLELDREMIVSGKAAAFHRELARIYGQGRRTIISADPKLVLNHPEPEPLPFAALGSHNYAALSEMVGVAGYSATVPDWVWPSEEYADPMHWGGIYSLQQAEELVAEDPTLLRLTLRSLDPLVVEAARGNKRHLFRIDAETGDFREVPLLTQAPGARM
jgi:hypothetical protein